jgi:hypothetical protein
MTVERTMRVLGAAGLIPTGSAGKRTAPFDSTSLARVFLSLGATQPSDAADAVKILSDLRCSTNPLTNLGNGEDELSLDIPRGMTLLNWVISIIQRMAILEDADRLVKSLDGDGFYNSLVVDLDVGSKNAHVSVRMPKSKKHWFWQFTSDTTGLLEEEPLRRRVHVRLDVNILAAAGRLLSDTLSKQSITPVPNSTPARDDEGNTAETKKAAEPASSNGPQSSQSAARAYPAPTQTAHPHKAQSTETGGSKQFASPPGRRGLRVRQTNLPLERTRHHGTHWSVAAPV